jgi:hypothetical protein
LFLIAPSGQDPAVAAQSHRIEQRSAALAERDLIVFQLFEDGGLVGDRGLAAADLEQLREKLQVEPGERSLILIGKDGGIKRRAPLDTELREVLLQIDAMPMRRSEMRAKEEAGIEVTDP